MNTDTKFVSYRFSCNTETLLALDLLYFLHNESLFSTDDSTVCKFKLVLLLTFSYHGALFVVLFLP